MLRHSAVAIAVLSLSALRVGAQAPPVQPSPPGVRTLFTVDSAVVTDVHVSPDSKWIIYSRYDNADRTNASIWMASAKNPRPFRITSSGYSDHWPEVSPTGDKVFFASSRPNRNGHTSPLYAMSVSIDRATGQPTGPVRQVTTDSVVFPGAVSPDGKWLAYMMGRPTPEVRLISTSGGNARTLARRQTTIPTGVLTFSSDGKSVVFADSDAKVLKRVPVSGGPAATILNSGADQSIPVLGSDQRYIRIDHVTGSTARLEVRDLAERVLSTVDVPQAYVSNAEGGHPRADGEGLIGAHPIWYVPTFAIKRVTFSTGVVTDVQPVAEGFLVGETSDGSIIRDRTVNGRHQLTTVSSTGKRTELTLGSEIDDVEYLLPGGTNVLAFGKDTTQCPKANGDPFPTGSMSAYAVDRTTGASRKIADAIGSEALYCFDFGFMNNPNSLELAETHGSNAVIETLDDNGNTHAVGSIPLATFQHVRDVSSRGTRIAYADSSGKDAVTIYVTTGPAGRPVRIADLPTSSATIGWSPDGRRLAAAYADVKNNNRGTVQIFDVAEDGSLFHSSGTLDVAPSVSDVFHLAWLPDGSAVLVQLHDVRPDAVHVVVRPVDPARPPTRLGSELARLATLRFEPSGKSALFTVIHWIRGSSVWTATFVPVKQP